MTEKQLIMSLIMTCLLSLVAIYFISEITMRMKNKTKKVTKNKITYRTTKIEICKDIVANIQQDFIGERKMIFNELVRM